MFEKYLITPALPYANGPIHLGHLIEQVQVNIFVRYLRMANKKVLYICGVDSHGTPIELNAKKFKISPFDFVKIWQESHCKSFNAFGINFDGKYFSTNIKDNKELVSSLFQILKNTRRIQRLFSIC